MFSVRAMRARQASAWVWGGLAALLLACGGGGGGQTQQPQGCVGASCPGTDPGTGPGTTPGTDPGTSPGTDPGGGTSPGPGDTSPLCSAARPAWPAGRDPAYRSPIAAENAKRGEADWYGGAPAPFDPATKRRALELYASRVSAKAGETVEVKVHSDVARNARWVLYRIGWYGGARARHVADGRVPVAPQPACALTAETGLVRCDWTTTFTIAIGTEHVSGYYAVKVIRRDAADQRDEMVAYAPIVVVDDRPADLLVQAGVNTWEAYNDYGGESLYKDESGAVAGHKAIQVSFDRPVGGAGMPSRFVWHEAPFATWLERMGYDVSYTTTNDVALGGCPHLARAGMYLQVGHDEYIPGGNRDAVEHARDAGVPLAFFSANPLYWKVRIGDFADARNPRTITVYKSNASLDPIPSEQTGRWRDAIINRPENAVLGVMYESWQVVSYPLVVADGASWLYEGTGLRTGDPIPLLVGHEYDRRLPAFASVEPPGIEVLAQSPVLDAEGTPAVQETVSYRAASGALVFAAGTIQWPFGLNDGPYTKIPGTADPHVERMTANVIQRAIGVPMPKAPQIAPRALGASAGPGAASVTTVATGLTAPAQLAALRDGTLVVSEPRLHQLYTVDPRSGAVTALVGQREVMGTRDGASVAIGQAKLRQPTGVAELPDGRIAFSDSGNQVIRVVDRAAGTVSILAGAMGATGLADGPGASARFSWPMGLASDAAGNLYVADAGNAVVRSIAPDGTVSTLAGGGTVDVLPGDAPVPAKSATVFFPTGVAVGADGTVYVAATWRLFAIAGGMLRALAGGGAEGFADGAAAAARVSLAGGAAASGAKLYFADSASFRLRAVTVADGSVETVAGGWRSARVDGPGEAARFGMPAGVAVGPDGTLYVTDAGAGAIRAVRP